MEKKEYKKGFIDPLTGFGLKKILGAEQSKDVLMSFLNDLLELPTPLTDLNYKNVEKKATIQNSSTAFDIYAIDQQDRHFVTDVQKEKQKNFGNKALIDASYALRYQIPKDGWDFRFKESYFISLVDFDLGIEDDKYVHRMKIRDQKGYDFYPEIEWIYIELSKFKKQEKDALSKIDRWLYFFKNIANEKNMPDVCKDHKGLEEACKLANLANMNDEEREHYEA